MAADPDPRAARPGNWARRCVRSPLAWVLLGVLALGVVGVWWGLPASDGWDNDGVAPRDFLVTLVELFSRGPSFDEAYLHYAPVQPAILGVLTSPIVVVALVKAPSLAPADVIHQITQVPYMTGIALVARIVTIGMTIGIVCAMAKIGEELGGRRAGIGVAVFAGTNAVLVFYAHTTCVDLPALFWASLALLALTRAITRQRPRLLRVFAVLAALAAATKDQEAGIFVLSVPVVLVLWISLDPWARTHRALLLRELASALIVGAAVFVVADGVLVNPVGYRARIHFLFGPASQDNAYYSPDTLGRLLVLLDSVGQYGRYYPPVYAPLVVAGLWLHVARSRGERSKLIAGFVPLLGIVSFTLVFNCLARRTEHRFLLPQMALWSVYGGLGLAWLFSGGDSGRAWQVTVGRVVAVGGVLWALFRSADVDANLLLDPRYDAEAWLREHVLPGEAVEVYGKNVYLLRLPTQAHGVRVGPDPVNHRNPIAGVDEVEDRLTNVAARSPRWIVVSEGYAGQFLLDARPQVAVSGRVFAGTQIASSADIDATTFFRGLVQGRLGYRMAHLSTWTSDLWPRLDIHASLSRDVWVFEKETL